MIKKFLWLVCIFIIGFLIFITVYKNKRISIDEKEHYFIHSEIKDFKTDDETDVNDLKEYEKNIINENIKYTDFEFYHENESITGDIYIDDNNKLYITDNNKGIKHLVSTVKFKTIYSKYYEFTEGIYVYLLDLDGNIYILSLETNDVRDAYINKYRYDVKFTNFVNIDIIKDMFDVGNTLFALTVDGKIYDLNTGLRYDERTIALYNQLYIYHDNTMTNVMGHRILNSEGIPYKVKYIFSIHDKSEIINESSYIIVVTENNEFIYFDKEIMYVYEFDKKVKDVKFDVYYPYVDGNLEIVFEDDYKVNFTARCNQYYCINEFAE